MNISICGEDHAALMFHLQHVGLTTNSNVVVACLQGEFKASAYYAECVDLIRKLVLSSLVGLLSPGTVIQSFATALFSLVFMVMHSLMCKCSTTAVPQSRIAPSRVF